jgi:hypothetical protein
MTTLHGTHGCNQAKTRRGAQALLAVTLATGVALPGLARAARTDFCSQTARTLFTACKTSVADDSLVKKAICLNAADSAKRAACGNELKADRKEANELCQEQRDGRLAACKLLGEGRYDPPIDPAQFDDPAAPTNPNPYFPLAVGNRWEFSGGGEHDVIDVVDETKLIAGVRCAVFRDIVSRDGLVVEATDDWFAPNKSGATWYFGEEVKDHESFDGDLPRRPELVSIDGSFKAGRNGDKPGIIFLASPKVGDVYVEEASLGNAEDVTEVLSTNYAYGASAELDALVPQALVAALCGAGDCMVTKNFSLLEPGIFARKYHAKGIGVFLEVEPDESKVIRLVSCNVDPRCATLPQP